MSISESEQTALLERFRALPTGNISDAMDKLALPSGVLPSRIKCVDIHQPAMAGFACTILQGIYAQASDAETKKPIQLKVFNEIAKAGDVIVIDAGNFQEACNGGGLLALRGRERGIRGIVVNGCYRDIKCVINEGMPLFCTGSSPRKSIFRLYTKEVNTPLSIESVCIYPGDVIVGDDTGVVVVPRKKAELVICVAERIAKVEARMEELVLAGNDYATSRIQAENEYPEV